MSDALIVFAKVPRPGYVKTRLTPPLSDEDASALYEAFLKDALEQYASVSADVRLYLAPEPQDRHTAKEVAERHEEAEEDAVAELRATSFLQRGGDLGERMLRAFAETFAAGYARAVVVGTDHPTLPTSFIQKAFDLLEVPRSVVIGPAEDGGYYLLGTNDLRPALFRGMVYSRGDVFSKTLDRAAADGAALSVLPPWYDVDTPEELRRLADDLQTGTSRAPRTSLQLRRLTARYEFLRKSNR